jgi:hypothetical protein
MTRLPLVLLLSAFTGCTETIELSHDPLANLESLEIVPGDAIVTLMQLAEPHHTLQYQAMGRFSDGSVRDVTSLVSWSLDDDYLGVFDSPGLFVASHAAVGHAHVIIGTRELAAQTNLTVVVDATLVDTTFPPPAGNLFDTSRPVVADDPTRSPELLYPSDGTVFPRAVGRTVFQVARGDGNDAIRIRFDNELLHLSIETGADRWVAEGAVQQLLSTAGILAPLRTEIDATASSGSTVYAGAASTLIVSRDSPGGPLYFWSAATNGIMRAHVESPSAAKIFPSAPGETTCVGCHAVSRDGRQLAMGRDNGTTFDLQAIDVTTLTTTIPAASTRPMGWATYSPDGTRMVVANDGVLTEYNAATGAAIGIVPLPSKRYATHPDWSPDGRTLAVALSAQPLTNMDVSAAGIALIPRIGTAWGAPTLVLTGSATSNNYFPRWSPDGSVLAFVHATTASRGAVSAEILLLPATGGATIPLGLANHRVGRIDLPDLATSMPAWAPNIGQHAWLAFVSARPYGNVLAGGRGQIWISAVDLTSPGDPSHPAFWLPSQDVTVLNNNPSWPSEGITQ